MSIVNERMKQLRSMSDTTLKDMAKKIGVSEATVQRYESGKIEKVPYKAIIEYSQTFKVNPNYIMGWIDNPHEAQLNVFDLNDNDESLKAYAEYLRVNTFETRINQEYVTTNVRLTNEEKMIIECYRKLTDSEKSMVKRMVGYAEAFANNTKE